MKQKMRESKKLLGDSVHFCNLQNHFRVFYKTYHLFPNLCVQRPNFLTNPRYAMTPKRESKRQWFMSNYI